MSLLHGIIKNRWLTVTGVFGQRKQPTISPIHEHKPQQMEQMGTERERGERENQGRETERKQT